MIRKEATPNINENYSDFIKVYFEFQKLKTLYRQGWLKSGIKEIECESVADHIFGVAILAMLINKEKNLGLDSEKLVLMSLLHEVGEIYLGDITPHDGISKEEKFNLEKEAAIKALNHLDDNNFYFSIWLEFEKNESREARFIQQLDKLEMSLQAKTYEESFGLNLSGFYDSTQKRLIDNSLKRILETLR